MKQTIHFAVFFLFIFFSFNIPFATAQTDSMMEGGDISVTRTQAEADVHTANLEAILQEFLYQQNVSTVQELDLSKIIDADWNRLGDAVMEVSHLGQAHEFMDRMMGGEGSDSLRQMHINMGKAYLGYGGGFGPGMMAGGMMGRGMMGNWNNSNNTWGGGGFPMMGFGQMMGYGTNAGVYGILGGLTWIALIAFLLAGTYFFIKQTGKK